MLANPDIPVTQIAQRLGVSLQRSIATLLHGYVNLLKRLDISESVNLHKYLISTGFLRNPCNKVALIP